MDAALIRLVWMRSADIDPLRMILLTGRGLAMRHSGMLFAVRWLVGVFAFGLVFTGIWAGASRGRVLLLEDWARSHAQEAAAAEAQTKHRESLSRVEIAEEHALAVEILDGLLHPYEEFNGKMAYPLFTED